MAQAEDRSVRNRVCVAIVGGGPMCTYAMERLAALRPAMPAGLHVTICVYEKSGYFGSGIVHNPDQSRTSYMNRAAGQIAVGADSTVIVGQRNSPLIEHPDFLAWCDEKFELTSNSDYSLRPTDVPKRYTHGQALVDAFYRYVRVLSDTPDTSVHLREAEVLDLIPHVDDNGQAICSLKTSSPDADMTANFILLTTGHSTNSAEFKQDVTRPIRYVHSVYPIEEALSTEAIPSGAKVIVSGLGLAAVDVFLYLTEGRGGSFEWQDLDGKSRELHYAPSGNEPGYITAFSRSGILASCRPYNEKVILGRGAEYEPALFTIDAVRRVREARGTVPPMTGGRQARQIDFELDLFPLVVAEMGLIYYTVVLGPSSRETLIAAVSERAAKHVNGTTRYTIDDLLSPLHEVYHSLIFDPHEGRPGDDPNAHQNPDRHDGCGSFDWRSILDPLKEKRLSDRCDYHRASILLLADDIEQAKRGNVQSPTKAACDGVWRDLRHVFCAAVDQGGLTPASQRWFDQVCMRYYNRLSNGASIDAMEKVLALLRAGVVQLESNGSLDDICAVLDNWSGSALAPPNQGTGEVYLLNARVHPFDIVLDQSPLYRNLIARGLVRKWKNEGNGSDEYIPGGVAMDDNHHPLTEMGTPQLHLAIIGPASQGVLYFQSSIARPYANSAVLRYVATWAHELVEELTERSTLCGSRTTTCPEALGSD